VTTQKKIVYCSGPLFSPEEIGGMTAIAEALEAAGYETFLPHRDGIEAYVMRFASSALGSRLVPTRPLVDRAIFALDVFQIAERADCLVFNVNGRVPDEGGVAETAIAYAIGTPVVLYKNDARAPFGGGDNAMLLGLTSERVVAKVPAIPGAVERAVRDAARRPSAWSPGLTSTVALGRKIWSVLEPANRRRGHKEPSDVVARIVEICAAEV